MKLNLTTMHYLYPEDIAIALSNAEPVEFSTIWLKFFAECKEEKLDSFAKEMAPDFGGNAKRAFRMLYDRIVYYETKRELEKEDE